ncbi:MAG TPA: hypothetical protein VEK34_10735 [Methylocella sp.]|nr:hypothetical protein [Methylocella sp.]
MALILTVQSFLGLLVGTLGQIVIVWLLLKHALPWIGFDLLALCQQLATYNLPFKILQPFTGAE